MYEYLCMYIYVEIHTYIRVKKIRWFGHLMTFGKNASMQPLWGECDTENPLMCN